MGADLHIMADPRVQLGAAGSPASKTLSLCRGQARIRSCGLLQRPAPGHSGKQCLGKTRYGVCSIWARICTSWRIPESSSVQQAAPHRRPGEDATWRCRAAFRTLPCRHGRFPLRAQVMDQAVPATRLHILSPHIWEVGSHSDCPVPGRLHPRMRPMLIRSPTYLA